MSYRCTEHCILMFSIWRVSFWLSVPHGDVPWTFPQHCTQIQTQDHRETSGEKLCAKDYRVTEWLAAKVLTLKNVSKTFHHIILYLLNKISHLNKFLRGLWMSSRRKILSWEHNLFWCLLQSFFWTLSSFGVHGRLVANSDSFNVNVLAGEIMFGHMSDGGLCFFV